MISGVLSWHWINAARPCGAVRVLCCVLCVCVVVYLLNRGRRSPRKLWCSCRICCSRSRRASAAAAAAAACRSRARRLSPSPRHSAALCQTTEIHMFLLPCETSVGGVMVEIRGTNPPPHAHTCTTYHIISIQFLRIISGPPPGTKPWLQDKGGHVKQRGSVQL